jgi:signal transduction histidine kinase
MTKPSSDSPFDLRLIAHDLRHLMGLVHGHAELLEGHGHDQAAMQQGLGAIRKAATRASSVCEDLLYFGDARAAEAQVLKIEQILDSVVAICAPNAAQAGIHLELLLPDQPLDQTLKLRGDALAVERALLNLTWNAVDAVQENGASEIELRYGQDTAAAGGKIWFEVADRGPGLPEALLGDLTGHGPGPEGGWPSTEAGQLHGFGLVLSALVARRHQGCLHGRRRRLGSGAVLRLEIPLTPDQY